MRHSIPALLLASLLPAAALAAPPASADVHSTAVRVSTGVVSAHLLNAQQLHVIGYGLPAGPLTRQTVVLDLNVNEKGMPSGIRVVRSVNPEIDAQVLETARRLRFQPATLDEQPVPVNMRLNVVLQR